MPGSSCSTWDTDLLLDCGKDNRTICWNPTTGDIVRQANWLLQTSWNLRKLDLIATASYDGTIAISPPPPHLLQVPSARTRKSQMQHPRSSLVTRVLFTGNLDTVVELCTQAGQRADALPLAQSEQDTGGLYGIRAMEVQHSVEKAGQHAVAPLYERSLKYAEILAGQYGVPTATGPYGAPVVTSPYGVPAANPGPYGAPASSGSYGVAPATSGNYGR
ncbi:protein transport protein S31 [Ceratobasidium sp. 370]|nr:protein transport protein S31 [Ceratobasidium sp. 370]